MGSSFIAYATIMAIILLVGEQWVRRSGRSPEWWDSWYVLLFCFTLTVSHILLEKDNHPLGMPSDPIIFILFTSITFFSGNRYVNLSHGPISSLMGQLLVTVNTFTEHFDEGWSVEDMQHTFVVSHYSDSPN